MYAVLTISIGAMVGSGIFVLPGLAASVAGPAIVVAYFLAGLVVLPAALSKSEMATAMPHAGGTYLYIDRAMGPLLGTIAGFGVWFSLVFKSAFALDGLGEYLKLGFEGAPVKMIALGLGAALIVVNVYGVRHSGRFQTVIVSAVLVALAIFVFVGVGDIDADRFEPFLPKGYGGLLAATGIVFVSYAGVTKIASIAEEVRRPARNIPRGILTSITIMLLLYPAIVFVIVGVTPAADLDKSATPVALAAKALAGNGAEFAISIVAVLALLSMANAGILASSRYPLAMARNAVAPHSLGRVGSRGTPVAAVVLTGSVLLVLIIVFPILELAKMASAFQLLVFAMVNAALIAFREARLDWYRPAFKSPLYPWMQIFGIVAPLILLSQMGVVPIIGAVLIVAVGVIWYRVFARSRTNPESAWSDALRVRAMKRLVLETRDELQGPGKRRILIPIRPTENERRLQDLLRTASLVAATQSSVQFAIVSRSGSGGDHQGTEGDEDLRVERNIEAIAVRDGLTVTVSRVAGRHRRPELEAMVTNNAIDLVLTDLAEGERGFSADMEWLGDRVLCDFAFLGGRYLGEVDDVVVLGSGGPLDPVKVNMAGRISAAEGATIRLVHVLSAHASGRQVHSLRSYHEELDAV
ncbi:MAG: APC family permease, partial [Acidimicrobiia bacterium]|nr:APC family permease [Acidimicrobiia bacterium]